MPDTCRTCGTLLVVALDDDCGQLYAEPRCLTCPETQKAARPHEGDGRLSG